MLSPDHQVVIALRYFRDLPVDAIASRLGIPAGTVQSRLHYALKRLHAVLDAEGTEGIVR
jgi:RNA polymerase sigma-70 factor (ECF subfamily)